MYVNIFKVENPNEPVATLNGGYHVLGRGTMLRCFDKRVSRTHAKLYIGDDSVSLTSTHINPCFHISAGGKSVTIIAKDATRELQHGDKFALLAEQFWYRMEIQEVKEENGNKSPQFTQTVVGVSSTNRRVSAANETICVADQSNEVDNKDEKEEVEEAAREKVEKPEALPSIEKEGERQVSVDDKPKISEKVDEGTIETDHVENVAGPSGISHNDVAEDASESLLHTNMMSSSNVSNDSQPLSYEENGTSQKRNISDDMSVSPKKRRKVSSDETSQANPRTPEGQMDVSGDKNDDIQEAAIIKDESGDEESQLELCLVESSEDMKKGAEQCDQIQDQIEDETNKRTKDGNEGEEESSECAQKEEATKQGTSDNMETHNRNEDKDETSQSAPEKEVNKDTNDSQQAGAKDDNTTDAGPSTSGVPGPPPAAVRRERCWYATSCYRKQPSHKVHFSHPGDDDYDDDAKDDRLMCAYGINCYRRNLNHRRQYRHAGPPAPRPNDTNDRRPRRAASRRVNYNDNNTPEDDYDYNDPFIDDGSSDEYRESDDADSGRDTDFTPSQDSEDISGLIADAKKFMNK